MTTTTTPERLLMEDSNRRAAKKYAPKVQAAGCGAGHVHEPQAEKEVGSPAPTMAAVEVPRSARTVVQKPGGGLYAMDSTTKSISTGALCELRHCADDGCREMHYDIAHGEAQ